jgi:neutral trehalase
MPFPKAIPDYPGGLRMQHTQSGFDLRHFVEMNFTLPTEGEKYVPPSGQSLRAHIDGLWPVLTRTTDKASKWDSLLPLPKPYVVPGGRFREVYYWDSYFTMLGWRKAATGTKSAIWWTTLPMKLIPGAYPER